MLGAWGMVVDGVEVPVMPIELMRQGKWASVPLLLGTNADEGTLFLPNDPSAVSTVGFPFGASETDVNASLKFLFGSQGADLINAEYADEASTTNGHNEECRRSFLEGMGERCLMNQIFADQIFHCPTRRAARAAASTPTEARTLDAQDAQPRVFLYRFAQRIRSLESRVLGDYHSSEIAFVFSNPLPAGLAKLSPLVAGRADAQLSDAMTDMWANFAKEHDPTPRSALLTPEKVTWPEFVPASDLGGSEDYLVLQEPGLRAGDVHRAPSALDWKHCDFWDSYINGSWQRPCETKECAMLL